jgi:hypothetical protein
MGQYVSVVAFVAMAGCGADCSTTEFHCPAGVAEFTLTSASGAPIEYVNASMPDYTITCRPNATGAVCEGGGDGTIHIESPGFQAVDVPSTVSETPAAECGCPTFTRHPSTVMLEPEPE